MFLFLIKKSPLTLVVLVVLPVEGFIYICPWLSKAENSKNSAQDV